MKFAERINAKLSERKRAKLVDMQFVFVTGRIATVDIFLVRQLQGKYMTKYKLLYMECVD